MACCQCLPAAKAPMARLTLMTLLTLLDPLDPLDLLGCSLRMAESAAETGHVSIAGLFRRPKARSSPWSWRSFLAQLSASLRRWTGPFPTGGPFRMPKSRHFRLQLLAQHCNDGMKPRYPKQSSTNGPWPRLRLELQTCCPRVLEKFGILVNQ